MSSFFVAKTFPYVRIQVIVFSIIVYVGRMIGILWLEYLFRKAQYRIVSCVYVQSVGTVKTVVGVGSVKQ